MIEEEDNGEEYANVQEMDYRTIDADVEDVKVKGKAIEAENAIATSRSVHPSRELLWNCREYYTESSGGLCNMERGDVIHEQEDDFSDPGFDMSTPQHGSKFSRGKGSPLSPCESTNYFDSPTFTCKKNRSYSSYSGMDIDELLRGMEADSDDEDCDENFMDDIARLLDFRRRSPSVGGSKRKATGSPVGLEGQKAKRRQIRDGERVVSLARPLQDEQITYLGVSSS